MTDRKLPAIAWIAILGASSLVLAQGRQGGPVTAAPPSYTNWAQYGGGAHSGQYSPLAIVNRSNVARLEVAWTYPTGGFSVFNPIVVDGVMYTVVQDAVVALDAATGSRIWMHPTSGAVGARGFNYWNVPIRAAPHVHPSVLAERRTEDRLDRASSAVRWPAFM